MPKSRKGSNSDTSSNSGQSLATDVIVVSAQKILTQTWVTFSTDSPNTPTTLQARKGAAKQGGANNEGILKANYTFSIPEDAQGVESHRSRERKALFKTDKPIRVVAEIVGSAVYNVLLPSHQSAECFLAIGTSAPGDVYVASLFAPNATQQNAHEAGGHIERPKLAGLRNAELKLIDYTLAMNKHAQHSLEAIMAAAKKTDDVDTHLGNLVLVEPKDRLPAPLYWKKIDHAFVFYKHTSDIIPHSGAQGFFARGPLAFNKDGSLTTQPTSHFYDLDVNGFYDTAYFADAMLQQALVPVQKSEVNPDVKSIESAIENALLIAERAYKASVYLSAAKEELDLLLFGVTTTGSRRNQDVAKLEQDLELINMKNRLFQAWQEYNNTTDPKEKKILLVAVENSKNLFDQALKDSSNDTIKDAVNKYNDAEKAISDGTYIAPVALEADAVDAARTVLFNYAIKHVGLSGNQLGYKPGESLAELRKKITGNIVRIQAQKQKTFFADATRLLNSQAEEITQLKQAIDNVIAHADSYDNITVIPSQKIADKKKALLALKERFKDESGNDILGELFRGLKNLVNQNFITAQIKTNDHEARPPTPEEAKAFSDALIDFYNTLNRPAVFAALQRVQAESPHLFDGIHRSLRLNLGLPIEGNTEKLWHDLEYFLLPPAIRRQPPSKFWRENADVYFVGTTPTNAQDVQPSEAVFPHIAKNRGKTSLAPNGAAAFYTVAECRNEYAQLTTYITYLVTMNTKYPTQNDSFMQERENKLIAAYHEALQLHALIHAKAEDLSLDDRGVLQLNSNAIDSDDFLVHAGEKLASNPLPTSFKKEVEAHLANVNERLALLEEFKNASLWHGSTVFVKALFTYRTVLRDGLEAPLRAKKAVLESISNNIVPTEIPEGAFKGFRSATQRLYAFAKSTVDALSAARNCSNTLYLGKSIQVADNIDTALPPPVVAAPNPARRSVVQLKVGASVISGTTAMLENLQRSQRAGFTLSVSVHRSIVEQIGYLEKKIHSHLGKLHYRYSEAHHASIDSKLTFLKVVRQAALDGKLSLYITKDGLTFLKFNSENLTYPKNASSTATISNDDFIKLQRDHVFKHHTFKANSYTREIALHIIQEIHAMSRHMSPERIHGRIVVPAQEEGASSTTPPRRPTK